MTTRIREFLKRRSDEGPCLVLDLDVVRDNYLGFAKALPDTKVFYAVKANPHPEVLLTLAALGSGFEVSSLVELRAVLALDVPGGRIMSSNPIKAVPFIQADCSSALWSRVSSGQPSVENGHSAELNQVSSTSSSWRSDVAPQVPHAAGAARATVMCSSGQNHAGMRCPHHSWREMHQSLMLVIQCM